VAAFRCKAKYSVCPSLKWLLEVVRAASRPAPSRRERAASVVLAVGGNASVANIAGAVVSQPTELWWHSSGVITLLSLSPPSVFKGIYRRPQQRSRPSEEHLPAPGSPSPASRALPACCFKAKLLLFQLPKLRGAGVPRAPRQRPGPARRAEQQWGSSALTLLSLPSGLRSGGFSSHCSDSGICFL